LIPQRGDGQHRDAVFIDQERIFIRAMSRTAVFYDAESPGGNLLVDPMIQQNDAVGNVFLQALSGQRAVATFARDERRDALVL